MTGADGGQDHRASAGPSWVPESVRAAIDRVIPEDEWEPAWTGGVAEYLTACAEDLAWARPLLSSLGTALDRLSFTALGADGQDAVLRSIEQDAETAPLFVALKRICFEGFYAARRAEAPAGLRMVGFDAVPAGTRPIEPERLPTITSAALRRRYDAVVIGSGPGGGSVARALSAAGKEVLLIERASDRPNTLLRGDHLRDKRTGIYAPSAGPGPGHPRVLSSDSHDRTIDGDGDAAPYGLNAMLLGGGTRIWQGMAWRFMPEDFTMASVYGNPHGASLADWPVDYAAMEPYYEQAERELGVAGEEGALTARTPRSSGYPMPPMPTEPARELLAGAADRLGWGWGPIPLALNSVVHDGRSACVRCPQCVGHACPVDAKNGSHNTVIPRALQTGHCDLLLDAQATRVIDGPTRATVRIVVDASAHPQEVEVDAAAVVVSAGAVETPRLLLASGVGNDHVGRYLHDHRFTTVLGIVDPPVKDYLGPGHSIATRDHEHSGSIPWGGGVMVDLMGILPVTVAVDPPVDGVPGWGLAHKEWMREGRRNLFGVFGIGQEIPLPTSRVTLAGDTVDRWGMPAARLRKDTHPASIEVENGMVEVGRRWLESAGATRIGRRAGSATASAAGEHSSGTMRMGSDPNASATDAHGRVRGTSRIYVADASLHPTNGSVNPALTVMANAFRVADGLLAEWPRR